MTYGSLFAGAGGTDLGCEAAGMSCAFQVEIDPTARAVLAKHWPDVPRREDVRECGKRNLPRCDVLVFGFPCQDLSVAGQRKGLQGGTRSGLFYEAVRIGVELRCQFLIWENVPGLLSSDDGRDFARVLRHLADCDFHGGCRVLDAQHFGLAQRRRRVFGVFSRGRAFAERCAEILALRESLSRDTPAGGKTGEEVAGTLGGGSGRRGFCDDLDRIGAFIPQVAPAISAKWAKGTGGPAGDECQNLIAFNASDYANFQFEESDTARPLTGTPDRSRGAPIVAFSCKDHGADAGPVSPTLRAMGHDASHANGGGQVAIAFTQNQGGDVLTGEKMHSLACNGNSTGRSSPNVMTNRVSPCLRSGNQFNNSDPGMEARMLVQSGLSVRRLTPRECERLMGWPDDHTRYRADGSEIADGPRYRLIGNGVAAPCAEWIARRLMRFQMTKAA